MITTFSRRRLTTNWYEKQSHAESFSSLSKMFAFGFLWFTERLLVDVINSVMVDSVMIAT